MNILFCIILCLIGIGIGNFLAIQAIIVPKSLNMKKTFYNKKTNEELRTKITYMILGGISSVLIGNILKLYEFDISNLIIYIFMMLYISTLMLIGGIDKNYIKIDKSELAFGIISSIIYMLYLAIVDFSSIYINAIYLSIYMIFLIIDCFLLRKYAKDSYIINILLLLTITLVFTNLNTLICALIMAMIAILLYVLILKIQQKKNGNRKIKINQIPFGYFITASNLIVLFLTIIC